MSKNRLLRIGLLALSMVICLTLVVPNLLPRRGITRANFERIEVGMTMEEAQTILGEVNEWLEYDNDGNADLRWISYDCRIKLKFANYRVTSRECGEGRPDQRTVWEKLKKLTPWSAHPDEEPLSTLVHINLPSPAYWHPAPLTPPFEFAPFPGETPDSNAQP